MKKNKMMRIASVLLVAVLLSTCAISGTFAKYTTSDTKSSSARVAKWDIDFAANDDTTKEFKFDLFNTIKDNDGTSTETDVKEGTDEKIIAPGTSGSFTISLKNLSEVTAQYAIEYTVTNTAGIPVLFSTDETTWKSTIDAVTATDATKLQMNATAATNITIYWKWPFTAEDPNTDEKDTNLGKADAATITVIAKVTVTQVD